MKKILYNIDCNMISIYLERLKACIISMLFLKYYSMLMTDLKAILRINELPQFVNDITYTNVYFFGKMFCNNTLYNSYYTHG